MDTKNPSAPSCAESRVAARKHPIRGSGGLLHDNARHTSHFVVIGNHLAQHPTLSALAIGLGVHIQSLPKGAQVDIKSLALRFPEGRDRIGAALRELEAEGYLRRERERIPDGRIVTRTVSCNRPGHRTTRTETPDRPARRTATTTDKPPPRKRLPAVPQPATTSPALLGTALDVLVGLRRRDPRLLLSATDAEHLAPGVAAWLERDIAPTAVRHALTENLPTEPLTRPAALLAHRLTAQLPPPPPFRPPAAPAPQPRHPFQTCDGCDRPFRSPAPGLCRDCRYDRAG
ncbi:helix-turn-helix domain-containing protein [Streptomyces arenae]|uniref:helix-turn-helix domain-containing protein n=1 Tax=Streptomyces arenae TaxID=29301 RepID=UPI00265B5A41|nr:helix-turn-helix domain-containing protein [Streptomyces arenae]MCG7210424.1 helix-turn-helix domain-containing protein [Streptomyces arenae]